MKLRCCIANATISISACPCTISVSGTESCLTNNLTLSQSFDWTMQLKSARLLFSTIGLLGARNCLEKNLSTTDLWVYASNSNRALSLRRTAGNKPGYQLAAQETPTLMLCYRGEDAVLEYFKGNQRPNSNPCSEANESYLRRRTVSLPRILALFSLFGRQSNRAVQPLWEIEFAPLGLVVHHYTCQ